MSGENAYVAEASKALKMSGVFERAKKKILLEMERNGSLSKARSLSEERGRCLLDAMEYEQGIPKKKIIERMMSDEEMTDILKEAELSVGRAIEKLGVKEEIETSSDHAVEKAMPKGTK
eukprot:Nk52_evm13s2657 gene=Nk52_evmTU13s2657